MLVQTKRHRIARPARFGRCLFYGITISIVCLWWLNRSAATQRSLVVSFEDLPIRLDLVRTHHEGNRAVRTEKSNGVDLLDAPDNIEPQPRPPLSSIVQGWNISGDASWLLQFSVIGFPKCGSSTLMHHLRDHPEVHMFADERCECSSNQHARLIKDLYSDFPASTASQHYVRGIKCPMDLENNIVSIANYKKFFPKTDFIVGIRHPVLWFESFYNFRVHNEFPMPAPEKLIGWCRKGANGVCTFRSNFHLFLNNLGKTDNDTILPYVDPTFHKAINVIPTKRKVFLYEISQLSDKDEHRSLQLRQDLQSFLHLNQPIPPFIWFKPGKQHSDESIRQAVEMRKIDICKHVQMKEELMKHAIQASQWIIKHFIDAEGVVVSSKDFLRATLEDWKIDPCTKRGKA